MTRYKVTTPLFLNYGFEFNVYKMLREGQIWKLETMDKDKVKISRGSVTIEIDKEHFEKYFEKVESEE